MSPTHNELLAEALAEIIELKPLGTLHVAGPRMNRYEFAKKIAETLGLPTSLVKPATMEEMQGRWVARRPRDSSLDTSKAQNLLETPFSDIDEAMERLKRDWENRRG